MSSPDMVDLAFVLQGQRVPLAYRQALADALLAALPWLGQEARCAVHRLNLPAGGEEGGGLALLSQRTRLTLRLPRERVDAACALSGHTLALQAHAVRVGDAQVRELLPFHTLYAHFVADAADAGALSRAPDDLAIQRQVEGELAARGLSCRAIFGRRRRLEQGLLHGAPVMLDGLTPATARRVLHEGLGPRRLQLLGCGVFVPHKSAAAVGVPD